MLLPPYRGVFQSDHAQSIGQLLRPIAVNVEDVEDDERQRHRPVHCEAADGRPCDAWRGSASRSGLRRGRSIEGGGVGRDSGKRADSSYLSAFRISASVARRCATWGLRPRRATGRPPSVSASASVTSSSRTPLLASANVIRIVAPLPSGISSPDMSLTRITLLATVNLLSNTGILGNSYHRARLAPSCPHRG